MGGSAVGSNNSVLLTIAVIAIGIYFLPTTLTIFSGQHTFYNGPNVSCRKCHSDIYDEIFNSPTGTPHLSFGQNCIACHRTGRVIMMPSYGGTFGAKGVNISKNSPDVAHSAVTVECVFCHNLIPNEINSSSESHKNYYNSSNQSTLLKGGNEACIGCHTHTTVNITWVRSTGYGIGADITKSSWNLSFSMNQDRVNTTTSGQ